MIYRLPYNGVWNVFSDEDLLAMPPDQADALKTQYNLYDKGRMAYFLGHGQGTDFVNDDTNDLVILLAGNQQGKSYAAMQRTLVRNVPCDPDWPCFTQHGLNFRPHPGGDRMIYIGTYSLKVLRRAIWPTLCELLPDEMLREYSPKYQGRGKKRVAWTGDCSLPLDFGTQGTLRIDFGSYSQRQDAVEGMRYDEALSDEQMPRNLLVGLIERGRTRGGINISTGTTPHRVKGRPDTGAGGWVHQAVLGKDTLGCSVGVYRIKLSDVPDAIYSAEEKAKAYHQHITIPTETQDYKKLREGKSRLEGAFESSEGLCLEEWDPKIHVIPPFEIPKTWTRYRTVDHADIGTCAALWAAVNPDGDVFLYREYYVRNRVLGEHAEAIVEASGNTRRKIGETKTEDGIAWPMYQEVYKTEDYYFSHLDPRSFNLTGQSGMLLGELYNNFGLTVTPGSTVKTVDALPVMNQWLARNPQRRHRVTNMQGAPRVYVFDTLRHFGDEAIAWTLNDTTGLPMKKDDHLAGSCFKFLIMGSPRYFGPVHRDVKIPGKHVVGESHGNCIVGRAVVPDWQKRQTRGRKNSGYTGYR